jgi:hypothetical protein
LILRGIKTVEYRTRPTRIIGERFYIYASKAKAARPIWSDDLRVATPPEWMLELAEQVEMIEPELLQNRALLPTGVIVGSAVIEKVSVTRSTWSCTCVACWPICRICRRMNCRGTRSEYVWCRYI